MEKYIYKWMIYTRGVAPVNILKIFKKYVKKIQNNNNNYNNKFDLLYIFLFVGTKYFYFY